MKLEGGKADLQRDGNRRFERVVGYCFFSIIINFVFSYKLATSGWLESLSNWKTVLGICRKMCLWCRMTEVVIDVAQYSCCCFKTSVSH